MIEMKARVHEAHRYRARVWSFWRTAMAARRRERMSFWFLME